MNPSPYEQRALAEIHKWKNPKLGPVRRAIDKAKGYASDFAEWSHLADVGRAVEPAYAWVVEKTVGGLVSLLNDAAQWSVRPEAIYKEFRDTGAASVNRNTDIHKLDLEDVDRAIGYLAAKYKALAAAEGGSTGAVGLPGIPIDIVALVALNLRAIGEYATYCGFDVSNQSERLFAMNMLGLASSPKDAAKQVAMANLVKLAKDIATKKTWKELERNLFVQTVKQIAKALGVRLTKAKLAQIVPVAGGFIGAGFNSHYTSQICDASFFLFRERFLAEKYGAEAIYGKT